MDRNERIKTLGRIPGCSLGEAPVPSRPQAVRGPTTALCKNIGVDATMAKCGFSMADLLISEARIAKVKGAQVNAGDIVAALDTALVNTNKLVNRTPLHETIRKEAKKFSSHITTVRNRLKKREGVISRDELPDLRDEFTKLRRKVEKLNRAVSGYCGNGGEMGVKVPRRRTVRRRPR